MTLCLYTFLNAGPLCDPITIYSPDSKCHDISYIIAFYEYDEEIYGVKYDDMPDGYACLDYFHCKSLYKDYTLIGNKVKAAGTVKYTSPFPQYSSEPDPDYTEEIDGQSALTAGIFVVCETNSCPGTILAISGSTLRLSLKEEGVISSWKSAGHLTGSEEYEVWHHVDGMSPQVIGRVAYREDGSYSFMHKTPSWGDNYYQIKELVEGEVYGSSSIESIMYDVAPQEVTILPHPVVDQFTLKYPYLERPASLMLSDMSGKRLQQVDLLSGTTSIALQADELVPGIYLVQVCSREGELYLSSKLLKQ